MKKVITLLLTAVLAVSALAGCGSNAGTAGNAGSGDKTKRTLSVATSPDFPPFESLDGTKLIGIEVELMDMIAEKMDVNIEYVQIDFDSVLNGVEAGKYDIGMSGISVTDERKENALFTDPYCLAAQAIVVTEGSPIAAKADLAGKAVSVQTGTTAELFCNAEGYNVSSFQANSDAESALVTGKVDAWVIDDLTAAEMVAAYNAENDTKLVILSEAMTTEPYAFMTKLGNDDLVKEINTQLDALVKDGTVKSLFEKYNAPYTQP